VSWPKLYCADAIAASGVGGAAAVYVNDLFVPYEFSMETAALLPGVKVWATSEHEHSGLRTGPVLAKLLDLAHDRVARCPVPGAACFLWRGQRPLDVKIRLEFGYACSSDP